MKFTNYNQLIEHIKQFPTQKEQLQEIIQYFIDNVEFDYVIIEHINQIVTTRFTQYVDRLFPNTNDKLREKALSFLRNSTNISNTYWERIKQLYLTPLLDDDGEAHYITLTEALNSIKPDYREQNGLLSKGIAYHVTSFAKQLCDSVGIKCLIVNGISSGKTEHYWLNICIDNKELFYDITYALYIRDNFCSMGKRYNFNDWLGINPKQLYKNQPSRTIIHPAGFNLEYLGLNNLPLAMEEYFDSIS